jgi:catechol 2,3-dioxygenase-like lactoylglutathione lyase family enzyme
LLYERDQAWKDVVRAPGTPYVDHVGILVEDIEAASAFYKNYMGLSQCPKIFNTEEYGGAKIAFVDANGYDDEKLWLKLIQPGGSGFARDTMDRIGKGMIFELGAQVPDIEAFSAKIASRGVQLSNIDGSAIAGGDAIEDSASGDRFGYIPTDVSCGIRIQVFQRGDEDTSIYTVRDNS